MGNFKEEMILMDESDGVHGPVDEEVIASLFEKHHGPEVYPKRTGRLPNWYTDNMKYVYFIFGGKIMSVSGWIDNQTYYILGGTFVNDNWKNETEYFGNPMYKVTNERESNLNKNLPMIAGFRYTGPVSPERNQETWVEKMKEFYDIEPMDTKGIPEEMIGNFMRRYPGAWGIRKNSADMEKMAKALWEWNTPTWWDVVKVQVLDTAVDLNINMEPMEEDKVKDEPNFPCCEKAREQAISLGRKQYYAGYEIDDDADIDNLVQQWGNMNCEDLYYSIKDHKDWTLDKHSTFQGPFGKKWEAILKDWQECVRLQGFEDSEHDEQHGWYVDYRDVGYR